MIEFKIMQCPEKSQLGNYLHWQNEISFGSQDADMVIDDPGISARQVQIFFKNETAFVQNLDLGVDVKINGQAVKAEAHPLLAKEVLAFGKTQIVFSKLNTQAVAPPSQAEFANQTRFEAGSR
jgi:pSer/pThr/pTyr-binding forkhead associated (FHA) protein